MPAPGLVQAITQAARARGVDPNAALAVAAQEGLGGGIGDQGTSFGPWQLHQGGALPSGIPLASAQQWAMSPAGIGYALDRIAGVAKGLHGADAVRAIVSKFERPANPEGEIARASHGLAGSLAGSPAVGAGPSGNPGLPPGQDPRRAFASALLAAIGSTGQLDNNGLVGALQARQQATGGAPASVAPGGAAGTPPAGGPSLTPDQRGKGGIVELLREGTGGPTHSTGPHIHAAFGNPQLELAAIAWAQQHGLRVAENPYVGSVAPGVHAKGSYHYQDFPGLYNGRKLGKAVDVTGPQSGAFYQWLASRR